MFQETLCQDCDGHGEIFAIRAPAARLDFAGFERIATCEACHGTGFEPCNMCGEPMEEQQEDSCGQWCCRECWDHHDRSALI